MDSEGHTYITKDGKKCLVLEGLFIRWSKYLEKHHELKNGRFQYSITKMSTKQNLEKIEKGIFLMPFVI